jgi:Ca2+/H+ antiporter
VFLTLTRVFSTRQFSETLSSLVPSGFDFNMQGALLLASTIILASMNIASGKTNAYGGTTQLSLFSAYLFTLFF